MTSCINANPPFSNAPLFPITPQSMADSPVPLHESLGSWLYRFCHANGYQDIKSTFSRAAGNKALSMGASTDAPYKTQVNIELIAAVTNLPVNQVERLMLGQALLAFQGKPKNTKGQWILRSGNVEQNGPWMRHVICPLCVLDSADPFWLQSWRLSTTTECRLHKIMLLETCPNCKAHFVIHSKRTQPLDRCECCNLHFSEMPVEACKITNAAPDFARHAGHNQPYSLPVAQISEHHWWRGVRQILSHIEDPRRAGLIAHRRLPNEFQELLLHISLNPKHCFDAWSIHHRHRALRFMGWLTTSWPHKFVDLLACTGRIYTPATYLTQTDPQWIKDAFRQLAIRAVSPHTPYRQRHRPLLSNFAEYLSIPIFKRGQKVFTKVRKNPLTHRWSPDHTVRVIKALDVRVLTMPGTVHTKARFIRGAAAIILERGALGYSIGDSSSAAQNEPMEQALQTVNTWTTCVRQLHASTETNGVHPSQQPAMRLNNGHLSKWLGCESLHAQIPLFRWTEQQPGNQVSAVQ
jgi:hypothetical protein